LEYRKDPLDYGRWSQPAKQVKKETDDLVIDYDEKVEDQNISNNDRRSVSQKLKMLVNYWRKQVYVNMHLRELEDEGEADI